ncbi:LysR family transcriptional regulator [Cytobacillus kochii]|uniref:LysR family transcriptional regulator n=1 Tax=Cytobacillus kochii TaxID=859143 RepID=UPI001CD51A56|nr:LysR family transcriptional regulator [Cytobacillus kochii]MCA1028700.1 LysR family transcriptional regulator [Cytobacillus kochii]MCM3323035.1 LysR family transcriptional regulator [Cytobacillus kochii]MCM3345430.1 LysR family transcriptional regulator [Cytobacillus kochii]
MDMKQLKTFQTAATTLNFTKTAKMLNFAQSSVTAQIKALEAELQHPLFERLGKKLVLTATGKEYKKYVDQMLRLNDEALQKISDKQFRTASLTIGAQESQCTYRLPRVLQLFKSQFPHVKLTFKPAHSDDSARALLDDGTLDLAFIMDVRKTPETLLTETLIIEELKMVAAPEYAIKSSVTLKDLQNESFLLTEIGCAYRTLLEQTLAGENVFLHNSIEFVSIEALKQCVIAGLGVAFLPAMVVNKELHNGQLKEVIWPNEHIQLYTQIAWHKNKQMTPPLQAFIDLTRNVFKEERKKAVGSY